MKILVPIYAQPTIDILDAQSGLTKTQLDPGTIQYTAINKSDLMNAAKLVNQSYVTYDQTIENGHQVVIGGDMKARILNLSAGSTTGDRNSESYDVFFFMGSKQANGVSGKDIQTLEEFHTFQPKP